MKLGVSMWSHVRAVRDGRLDLFSFVHEAKRIGAEGVELLDHFWTDRLPDRARVKEVLAETGLPCGVFSTGNNFAKADTDERAAQLEKILLAVEDAVELGAGTVRVFAGDVYDGGDFDTAREWIIEGLTFGADAAKAAGVKLALENHGKLAGRGDQVRKIIDAVRQRCGHDALGANPDTGNFILVGQAPHDAIQQVADYAYMVHFKDFAQTADGVYAALDGTKYQGTVIGEGEVDLAACLAILRDANFDGWVNLEYEGAGDPIAEVEQSMANSRRFVHGA